MNSRQKPKEPFVLFSDYNRLLVKSIPLTKACFKIHLVTLVIFSVYTLKGYSQADSLNVKHINYLSISANYQNGTIMPTTDFVKGDNLLGKPMQKYQALSLKMLWQNPGYTDWQRVYHGPYYGAGLQLTDVYNQTEVGYPVSLFGVLGIPIVRAGRFELYSEFQFGIAAGWKHYDTLTNPKNLAVGGTLTLHVNGSLLAFYQLTRNIDLGAGIGFIHFSNGGFERPNNGLNIYSPSVELKYHFQYRPDYGKMPAARRLQRSDDLYLMLGYGDYQLREHELDTNYFAVGGLSAVYFTQFSNAFRLGYGTDINYWWGMNARPNGTAGLYSFENFTLGLILQPEFIIDKLTLVSGIGIYALHRNYGNFNQTYQRLGVRYDIYKNVSLGVNVRAINFTMAEFLEFNLGYRIKWVK
jgi:hypothetical protein